MKFDNSAYEGELRPLFSRFLDIAPWALWRKRFDTFKAWSTDNPIYAAHTLERYPLEVQMMLIDDGSLYGDQLPRPSEDAVASRFYSFVSMVARVHQRLNPRGKAALEGMIFDGLKDEKGLGPLAFELGLAGSLMHKGWDVTFNDLEKGGGPDFLIESDGALMEVECKYFSPDIGRQIHRKQVYDFAGGIWGRLQEIARRREDGLVARVIVPHRFPTDTSEKEAIARCLLSSLDNLNCLEEGAYCSVLLERFDTANSPFASLDTSASLESAAREYVERLTGSSNKDTVVVGIPQRGVVVVLIESAKPDTVMDSIFRRLKVASKSQLTGQYPGMLCIHLADMTGDGLERLAESEDEKGTAIQHGSSEILTQRPSVHSIVYQAPGVLTRKQVFADVGQQSVYSESGKTYGFRNPNHPQYHDPRYCIF